MTRAFYRLVLSADLDRKDALDSMVLCRVAMTKLGGTWQLEAGFVPALVQAGNNPFLRSRLDEVSALAKQIEDALEVDLDDPLFRGERMESARRCQTGAARLRLLLSEIQDDIHPHPYVVFDTIRAYDFDLAALYAAPPTEVRYRHDDLAGCFDELIASLRAKAGGAAVSSPSLPFVQDQDDRPFVARPFPADLGKAAEVYLVVDRTSIERTPLDWLKLASPGRLDEVIREIAPGRRPARDAVAPALPAHLRAAGGLLPARHVERRVEARARRGRPRLPRHAAPPPRADRPLLEEPVTARVRDEAPVSFLSRLGGGRPDDEPEGEARFEREVLAITRNLAAVLNTRKGTGSVVADLGLGDYEGTIAPDGSFQARIATKDVLAALVPEIGAQVARYEPRLADPAVAVVGRDRDLRAIFALTGLCSGRPVRFRLSLHTLFRDVVVEAQTDGAAGG